ncbi:MAG: hypothetical protein C0599_14505 [Salinivirgaceae bacterium]|nr:MAG: hypothetical protein C0599_14505 [Salinivirgaceae bacterium]
MFGQNDQLILKKYKSNKQKVIESSETIKVITNSGKRIKGKFNVIDEKTLAIGVDTIKISDIKKIRYRSIGGIITGGIIGTSGLLGAIGGAGIIISTSSEGALAAIIGVVLGVPVLTAGTLIATTGILVATVGKAHKPKKWEYRLVKAN